MTEIDPSPTVAHAFRATLSGHKVELKSSVPLSKRTFLFVAIQTAKTIKNPARLLYLSTSLPATYIRKLLRFMILGSQKFFTYLPPPLLGTRLKNVLAAENVFLAEKYLSANDPERAWYYFSRCVRTSSDPTHFFLAAICLMVGLGQFRGAMRLFSKANDLRRQKAVALGLRNSPIHFLEQIWVGSFGHMAQTDYFIKSEMLAGRDRQNRILYLDNPKRLPNPFFFEQLRPHLTVYDRQADLPLPLESLRTLAVDFLAPRLADGSTVHLWKAAADTYQQWQDAGRGPIFVFPEDVRQRALDRLESVGVPRDAWFVTLHVRERTSKSYHADLHSVLDASVEDYIAAINEITGRGGWVIRIGDPSMKPLPPMPNVLDYCHSSIRADWMDIFLLANCRFFLGTSSGPAYVPAVYGVPCVLTNWWPPAQRPWFNQDIFIPKLHRKLSGEYLTLSQSLAEPFGYCNSMSYLNRTQGVTVEDNSPIDIHAAVLEMFDRMDKREEGDESVNALRLRAEKIYKSSEVSGSGQLARGFLKRHHGYIN